MQIIRTELLTKYFGTKAATNAISLHVEQGEIYGFLGLNGAGKTTLIRMLLGMIKPDRGSVAIFGKEITPRYNLWNDIGYLVETPYSYPNLSVAENLKVWYTLRQLDRPALIDDVLERLRLTTYRDTRASVLSLGNQQRLGLAKALLHHPGLLILDEPINGLDPEGIVEVRELLKELSLNGTTIFLSSHILGEISKVASRIGIIHEGTLVKELTIRELTDQLIRKLVVTTTDNAKAVQHLADARHAAVLADNGRIEITGSEAMKHPERVAQFLVEQGLPPKELYQFVEDLEMYFLRTIRSRES